MNCFENVEAGQDWKPEPFQRYNAVNALLADFGNTGSGRMPRGLANRAIYAAVNRDTAAIGIGTAVEPSADLESGELVPVKASAAGTSALWGVAISGMEPGDTGTVLLSGVVMVQLEEALPTGTAYLSPGEGGKLIAGSDGRAQVIAAGSVTEGENTYHYATILLGGGGGGGGAALGLITSVPSYGSGQGTYREVAMDALGNLSPTGPVKPIVIPRIYHKY